MLTDSYRHKGMRKSLVRKLREKGISDERVLQAINNVPRHFFFDNAFLEHAYQDKAFPIGEGQTISQPYTVAFQTEKLEIQPGEKVLEIGTGSGYQACILLELGAKLYTIEFNKVLYAKAKAVLPRMGYQAQFFCGDGSKGLLAFAPFNKIIVTAGAPSVPSSLIQQLGNLGKMIIPVGNHKKQKMYCITKSEKGNVKKQAFDYFSFVPLLGDEGWRN